MSQNTQYDCVIVFPHGLINNKNDVNSQLAVIANTLFVKILLICPAQIWYYLEDWPFLNEDTKYLSILPRNARTQVTSVQEIVDEVKTICNNTSNFIFGVIAYPDDQDGYIKRLNEVGVNTVKIDCSAVT